MGATATCEAPTRVRHTSGLGEFAAGLTLGQLLARAHEGVLVDGSADCPVCGGVMERRGVDSACTSCGCRLS